jgi:hypothetical protein
MTLQFLEHQPCRCGSARQSDTRAPHSNTLLAHHRSVKLVQTLPLLLARLHDIDLMICQRPLRLDAAHNSLCGVTEPTRAPSEESYPAIEETRCRAEHGQDRWPGFQEKNKRRMRSSEGQCKAGHPKGGRAPHRPAKLRVLPALAL